MSRAVVLSAAVAALALAPLVANAGITFISYGTALPAGEHLVTDFSTSAGLSGTYNLVTGSVGGEYAAPAFSPTTFDTSQYLEVPGGDAATLTLGAPTKEVSIYIGSLDAYNTLSFTATGPGYTYTGTDLGAISGADDGDQTAADTNGRFVFTFTQPVTSITLSSSQNAFEVADVAAAVPEPGAWAVMLVGAGLMGAGLRASRRRAVARA